jgi:hypothetical protein
LLEGEFSLLNDGINHLPEPKRTLLAELTGTLSRIPGMAAVVLGGSYASHTQHAASDMDIGLYYHEAQPFAIADIRRAAESIADGSQPTVTDFYQWGAWVNGGAWIHTAQGKVDFLYRSLEHVQRTIAEAQLGISHHDYNQQPAYGFYSVIYLAETQICIPLYDPDGQIAALKRQVTVYPQKLKRKIVSDTLWSAEFTLLHAQGFAAHGDVYNTVGCLTRAAGKMTQALFALNERYFMRDKQVMESMAAFPILPEGHIVQVNRILACPGSTAGELTQSVSAFGQIWRGVAALAGELYQPKFDL